MFNFFTSPEGDSFFDEGDKKHVKEEGEHAKAKNNGVVAFEDVDQEYNYSDEVE